jgi:hypothetical protein
MLKMFYNVLVLCKHGLWLKAHVSYIVSEKFISKSFFYNVNGTLFSRNDDRRVVECVWNDFYSIYFNKKKVVKNFDNKKIVSIFNKK